MKFNTNIYPSCTWTAIIFYNKRVDDVIPAERSHRGLSPSSATKYA